MDDLIESEFLSLSPKGGVTSSRSIPSMGTNSISDVDSIGKGHAFSEILGGYVSGVNTKLHDMDAMIQGAAAGTVDNPEEIKLTLDEGKKSFQLFMSIKNETIKMLEQLRTMIN